MIAEDFFKKYARSGPLQTDWENGHWRLQHEISKWSKGTKTFREFIEEWKSPTSFFKETCSRRVCAHVLNGTLSSFGCERWT